MSETPELVWADQVFSLHPFYEASRAKLVFLMDAYTGSGGFEDGAYLDPHPRELRVDETTGEVDGILEKYRNRQSRAYYPNVVKTVVDVPVQYVYQSNIVRDGAEEWKDFTKDCNGRGTPFNTMMDQLSRYARLFGAMFFVIDKPAPPEGKILTAADDKKYKPRAIPVFPFDVVDWHMQDGQLEWVKILERHETATPLGGRTVERRIRIWTRTGWQLYSCETEDDEISYSYSGRPSAIKVTVPKGRKKGQSKVQAMLLDEGFHDLGRVPLVGVHAGAEPEFGDIYATTDVYQSAMMNRRMYNILSELDEIIRDQTFSILTMPVENPEDSHRAVIGVSNGLAYKPTQSGLRPEYIAPDGECAKTLAASFEQLRGEIYRAAHLDFAQGVQEVRSGVAKEWNFDETNRFLASIAHSGENAEREAGYFVMKWSRPASYVVKETDVKVNYPSTFNVCDIKDAIEETDMVIAMGVSKTMSTLKAQDLAYKMFPNLPDSEREKIEQEIASSPNIDPPPIDGSSSTDAAKGGITARVKAKRGRVKRYANDQMSQLQKSSAVERTVEDKTSERRAEPRKA